ncbi:MAG: NAD(P)/FAD-dependent oxidoreductase [Hyphomicrobiaceae bacterium]|nr:MAG: NAD(P)/FAD-dependent oxidoreductase [Hyphomicrobiaceae bacterium]
MGGTRRYHSDRPVHARLYGRRAATFPVAAPRSGGGCSAFLCRCDRRRWGNPLRGGAVPERLDGLSAGPCGALLRRRARLAKGCRHRPQIACRRRNLPRLHLVPLPRRAPVRGDAITWRDARHSRGLAPPQCPRSVHPPANDDCARTPTPVVRAGQASRRKGRPRLDKVECIVVGAGVVGLAAARALANAGREVLVLEAAEGIGTGTSSRNSEVIHAGIYYPRGGLKAITCVRGRDALYAYARERGLPHARCGKLIVATSAEEEARLEPIRAQAAGNGVHDLVRLTGAEARAMEPALNATSALLSPSTGIVDSHAFMQALEGDVEARGGLIVFHSPVEGGRVVDGGLEIEVGGGEPTRIGCRFLVNAAGLMASRIAASLEGMPKEKVPAIYPAKGNYFTLSGRAPFKRLIYPVPVAGGLGVHLTIDLAGEARFGPDVEWIDWHNVNYDVDPRRGEQFYAAIRRYWPGLEDGRLQPGYAGIRPKLSPKGAPADDFLLQGPAQHGVPGLVNLFGIESPGLTASLAIAEMVAAQICA